MQLVLLLASAPRSQVRRSDLSVGGKLAFQVRGGAWRGGGGRGLLLVLVLMMVVVVDLTEAEDDTQ